MAEGHDVRVFYIQYVPMSLQSVSLGMNGSGRRVLARRPIYASSPANVQKMLKPLKVNAFQVSTPEDARKVLARILEEIKRP
jgi:hypothetical protein